MYLTVLILFLFADKPFAKKVTNVITLHCCKFQELKKNQFKIRMPRTVSELVHYLGLNTGLEGEIKNVVFCLKTMIRIKKI